MSASDLVKAKRKAFGMSQKQFAELLGLKENGERTIRGWENGEHTPTHTKIAAIEANCFCDIPNALRFAFTKSLADINISCFLPGFYPYISGMLRSQIQEII